MHDTRRYFSRGNGRLTYLALFLNSVVYSFMVVVVLLNVLIALASDSYEKCLVRSQYLFGRARVMLIAELVSFQNLLRRHGEEEVATYGVYSVWCWSDSWANGWSRGKSKATVHPIQHWLGRCVMS